MEVTTVPYLVKLMSSQLFITILQASWDKIKALTFWMISPRMLETMGLDVIVETIYATDAIMPRLKSVVDDDNNDILADIYKNYIKLDINCSNKNKL